MSSRPASDAELLRLPGGEILVQGLRDLRTGIESPESLVLLAYSERLGTLGVDLPPGSPVPPPMSHRLYAHLVSSGRADPYSYYNALLRRMASLIHALEAEQS